MRIIPVIDLLGGQVVRGVGGRRAEYRPIVSALARDSSPRTVAEALAERFHLPAFYVADLDAIQCGQPDVQSWRAIAGTGAELWLDAGIGTASAADATWQLLRSANIPAKTIVGLESLASEAELPAICRALPASALIFSLDLRELSPLTRIAAWQTLTPLEIAERARSVGIDHLIVLDLADVGSGQGSRTLALCQAIRERLAPACLIAGGGVRSMQDLRQLTAAGADAVLVASALHDGRLSAADVAAAAAW